MGVTDAVDRFPCHDGVPKPSELRGYVSMKYITGTMLVVDGGITQRI
jgi:hypothetical protein